MDQTKLMSMLIPKDLTIKQAMQKLNDTAERVLFVVDKKNMLLGTITDGDIRRALINGCKFTEHIQNIMRKNCISVYVDTPDVDPHIKKLMIGNKIEQIPIIDKDGLIIDIVLWTDILQGKRPLDEKKFYDNQVVIMAGGKGLRLDPFTKILPKPLIPIGNRPIIEHIMEKFYKYGFYKFTFTLNYKKEYLKLFLKDGNFPYEIDWIEEEDFLGTVGGLSLLSEKLNDTFFVANCDSMLNVDLERVLAWHKEQGAAITIIGCHNEVKIPYGVLELSNGKLEKLIEKPVHDVIINTGIYIMEPRILKYLKKEVKIDMDKLINGIAIKEKVSVYPIYGGWFDIGQWEEYKKNIEIIEKEI